MRPIKAATLAALAALVLPWTELPARQACAARGDLNARARTIAKAAQAQYGKDYTTHVDRRQHLVFVSALDRQHLDETIGLMSDFQTALRRTLPLSPIQWNIRVVLPTVADYEKLVPPSLAGCVGFYCPVPPRLVSIDRGRVLLHEFVHALHHADAAAARQRHPTWIREGLATLFESARITPSGLEPQLDTRLWFLQRAIREEKAVPLAKLLATKHASFMAAADVCYAQSRYLMYYLHAEGRLPRFYKAYKAAFAKDHSGAKALETVLNAKLDAIEDRWRQWVLARKLLRRRALSTTARLGIEVKRDRRGMRVVSLAPDGPAKRSGRIRVNDVIVKLNGRPTKTAVHLLAAIRLAGAQTTVTIELLRNGRAIIVRQPLGKMPDRPTASA